jgi:uncharacterized MAPEG superfamily protein
MAVVVVLFIVQILVADLARVRGKIVPGIPVKASHDNFIFRADRAHANTIENLGAFTLATILAILVAAEPAWVNALALTFTGARAVHMICYYLDARAPRSVAFIIGTIAMTLMSAVLLWRLASV